MSKSAEVYTSFGSMITDPSLLCRAPPFSLVQTAPGPAPDATLTGLIIYWLVEILPTWARTIPFENASAWEQQAEIFQQAAEPEARKEFAS
jgi:hypothetical protein